MNTGRKLCGRFVRRHLLAVLFTFVVTFSIFGFYRSSISRLFIGLSVHEGTIDDEWEELNPEPGEDEGRVQLQKDLIRRFESQRGNKVGGKYGKDGRPVPDGLKALGNMDGLGMGFKRFDQIGVTQSSKVTSSPLVVSEAEAVKGATSRSFMNSLEGAADPYKRVIICVVDYAYVNFALNFKRLSIDKLNITNFLLVCTDQKAVTKLSKIGISCAIFDDSTIIRSRSMGTLTDTAFSNKFGNVPVRSDSVDIKSNQPSDFGTAGYYRKTNTKTAVVLQALSLGYSVLIVDPDVVLFKDPFPYFTCTDCDVHYQMDRQMYNSGFAFIRPSLHARELYKAAWNLYAKYQRGHDQTYINMAIRMMQERKIPLRIHSLSTKQFVCGVFYFEHHHRMFGNQPTCEECVMAHNNYLGSVAAKIYRFKENLLWAVDEEGYYSNTSVKYITYDNPVDDFKDASTLEVELSALKTALALATLSNRTLILPRFHCCPCDTKSKCSHSRFRCSLLSITRMRLFDQQFRKIYRESSFLRNPLVPKSVLYSKSPVLFINATSSPTMNLVNFPKSDLTILNPENDTRATLDEMLDWIRGYDSKAVVSFYSLYEVISSQELETDRRLGALRMKIDLGFQCSEYEQWEKSSLEFINL